MRLTKLVLVVGVALGSAFVFIQIGFLLLGARYTYSAGEVPPAQTAIVLGAKVNPDGNPSDILADRLITALELYQDEKVEKFLLSGDHGQGSYDEVKVMRDYLLAYDVAPEDIFLDHAGFDTYDSMYRARDVFQVTDAIVVTQKFHLPRAVLTARALGLGARGVAADRQPYVKAIVFHLRETLARVKALKDIFLKSKPAYLGDPIPITGDGRATWDDL